VHAIVVIPLFLIMVIIRVITPLLLLRLLVLALLAPSIHTP
jgi:hypothetical protein